MRLLWSAIYWLSSIMNTLAQCDTLCLISNQHSVVEIGNATCRVKDTFWLCFKNTTDFVIWLCDNEGKPFLCVEQENCFYQPAKYPNHWELMIYVAGKHNRRIWQVYHLPNAAIILKQW